MNILTVSILLCCASMCYAESRISSWSGVLEPSAFIKILEEASRSSTRSKRQTNSLVQCSLTSAVTLCSTGINEGIVNTYAECGRNDLAAITVNTCAKDEMGQFCFAKPALLNGALRFASSCSGDLSQNTSCSSRCSSALATVRGELGCCINALLNVTTSVLNPITLSQFFTSDLWERCGVEPVGTCSNIPSFTPGTRSPPCSNQKALQSASSYMCSRSRILSILNALDSSCQAIAERLVNNICSQKSDGEFCRVAALVNLTSITSDFSTLSSSCTDPQACSSGCKTAIEQFRGDLGCCLNNLFNSSISPIPAFNYELWNTCEVASPGFCLNNITAGAGTNEAALFMVVAMAMTALKFFLG